MACGEGFYKEERDGLDVFRWMSSMGQLDFQPDGGKRFLEISICCEFGDLSQHVTVRAGNHEETLELVRGWGVLSVEVPPHADRIDLETNKLFPKSYYPSDDRELAIRIRRPFVHTDAERHDDVRRQWSNAVLNTREMLAGKTTLTSTPPQLGIDLHGACNVKPPCVYCEWDDSKEKEGTNVDRPFTLQTLDEYGDFFGNTARLQNCSIGEPFMKRDFDDLLDVFGDRGKFLEMSTNGQILTERNIRKLLGRNIHLYISLDAATPETYRRLRNDTFERILANIRRLVEAKGGVQGLPKVFLVFMPMKANIHELAAFVKLCAELQVDQLVLRPLNTTLGNALKWDRAGYHFDYDQEILPFEQLVRASGQAATLCQQYGVAFVDQLDFGGELESLFDAEYAAGRDMTFDTPPVPAEVAAPVEPKADETTAGLESQEKPSLGSEQWPICTEPWTNLYILRRGVMPCSYGFKPIAEMDDYRQAWNSPLLQEIRADLRNGNLHTYCLSSKACPILRKWERAHKLSSSQRASLWIRRLWEGVNAVTGGWPRRGLRKLRPLMLKR